MSLTAVKKEIQGYILDGMARSLWVWAYIAWTDDFEGPCRWCGNSIHREGDEWFDNDGAECEESDQGHEPDDDTTDGPRKAARGEDWFQIAPETPDAAYLAARDLAKLFRQAEGMSLPDLFELAVTVDQAEFSWEMPADRERLAATDQPTQGDLALEFGADLASMALGTGVSWFDDHKQTRLGARFDPKILSFECHYDGEELRWEGFADAALKGSTVGMTRQVHRGQHRARWESADEPIVGPDQIGKIRIVNPNDVNFYKHSYVLQFGAYGDTRLLVYASSLDSGLEECIDWLADNAPGLLADDEVTDAYNEAINQGKTEEQAYEYATTDMTPGDNGHYIASHEWAIVAEDPTREQLFEIGGLGGELEVNPAHRNPAGLTKKGERMYRKIRDGYTEVGKQKAKEIAARTVLARAKGGARGLVRDQASRRRPRRARGRR
jgi:hypothetical protein